MHRARQDTKGQATVAISELGPLLGKARDVMMARGGANLGDKTVLDALDAVSQALTGLDDGSAAKAKAAAAARSALAIPTCHDRRFIRHNSIEWKMLRSHPTTINKHVVPGDIRRLVTGEEQGGICDIKRLAQSRHRRPLV